MKEKKTKKSILLDFLSIEKFAKKVLIIIFLLSVIFIAAMIICFLYTGQEQSTLISSYFTAVVVEIGVLMAKTVVDSITEKINFKKEELESNKSPSDDDEINIEEDISQTKAD